MNTYSFSEHSENNCLKILVIDHQTTNFFPFSIYLLKKEDPHAKKWIASELCFRM